uniref:Calponin-homology (CH) domain-containing protein n=1 Tax=Heterorhabditis bacteriophora TaxID=37862 RepID=A0A1I7XGR2_HETBA
MSRLAESKHSLQEEEDRRRAEEEAKRRAFEAARLKALEDADRLRREREAAEAARRAAEDADRARRLADEAERARKMAEDAERRRREEEERRRRDEAERRRREDEDRRRREEEERRRREEEERRKMPSLNIVQGNQMHEVVGQENPDEWDIMGNLPEVAKITEHEDEIFSEAEKWGIIDGKRGFYLDKNENKRMSFTEAAQQHRMYPTGGVPDNAGDAIHTTVKVQTRTQVAKKEATSSGALLDDNTLGKALSLGWYEPNSGMFIHPDTQKQMTLKEAIIKGLFNPYDTTVIDKKNTRTLSLLEAIQEGIVDDTAGTVLDTQSKEKYDLNSALNKDAVKCGMIALIASPMKAAQAVAEAVKRRDAEGYKFKIENYDGGSLGSRTSVPKFREETTITRLTPHKTEPTLSVRMRQSQTSLGDRSRSLIDDPSTIADLQHEFLSNLEANQFDTDEKIITNPSGGPRLSVREAAETGLLDVLTGEIVVPESGRRYSIPKAVHLNYVQGDAAKRLMESLNMSIEELNLSQQGAPSPGLTFSPDGSNTTRTWTKTIDLDGKLNRLTNEARQFVVDQTRSLEVSAGDLKLADVNGYWLRANREIGSCGEDLKKDISDMEPVGRSQAELAKQLFECDEINKQILEKENDIEMLAAEWNRTLEDAVVSKPQWEPNWTTINDAKNVSALVDELNVIGSCQVLTSTAVVSDPRVYSDKLKQLKDSLKPVGDRIDNFVADCRLLIKTAGPETDTTELVRNITDMFIHSIAFYLYLTLENRLKLYCKIYRNYISLEQLYYVQDNALESVSDAWSLVSATVAEREIEIDAAVQQMGRYEDAYKAILNWLEETEEMMENQRPPAPDAKVNFSYKNVYINLLLNTIVSKAHLHAYDVLLKHIEDKQTSIKGFSSLIDKVTEMNEDEKKSLKQKNQDVWKRYNNLLSGAQDRQARLMDAVDLAERLAEATVPLDAWFVQTEKRLTELANVPTDTGKVDIQLREQRHLEEEIAEKGKDVDQVLAVRYFQQLKSIVPMLCALVGVEDAKELEIKSNQLASRYDSLAERNRFMKGLLADIAVQVGDFVQDANNLSTWLDDVEHELFEINELAIEPNDLIEQTNILSVKLKKRCNAVGIYIFYRYVDLIFAMEEDIVKWRPEIDDLVAVSTQLQALSAPDRAEELFQNTVDMNKRVNQIADKVRTRLREVISEAKNISKQIDFECGEATLIERCDQGKELIDEVGD